jgi:hypothetical protein
VAESEILTAVKGHAIEVDGDGRVASGEHEYYVPEGEDPPALTLFIREGVTDAEAVALLSQVVAVVMSGRHREEA